MNNKFKTGDKVLVDGEIAVITEVYHDEGDRNQMRKAIYTVDFVFTEHCYSCTEDELEGFEE